MKNVKKYVYGACMMLGLSIFLFSMSPGAAFAGTHWHHGRRDEQINWWRPGTGIGNVIYDIWEDGTYTWSNHYQHLWKHQPWIIYSYSSPYEVLMEFADVYIDKNTRERLYDISYWGYHPGWKWWNYVWNTSTYPEWNNGYRYYEMVGNYNSRMEAILKTSVFVYRNGYTNVGNDKYYFWINSNITYD